MSSGTIASAIDMLSETQSKGILALDALIDGKTVEQILNEKHPAPAPANHKYVSQASLTIPRFSTKSMQTRLEKQQ